MCYDKIHIVGIVTDEEENYTLSAKVIEYYLLYNLFKWKFFSDIYKETCLLWRYDGVLSWWFAVLGKQIAFTPKVSNSCYENEIGFPL